MAVLKCKMCGGELNVEEDASVAVCDYCGTKQTVPKTNNEIIMNLFNRANNLRLKCEFDKAASIYEKIVQENDSEAEAHWGLVLCKFGIEYVDDPKTHERIPTCHRTLFESITADVDYQAAIDYSDSLQQAIYEQEARKIDRIQKDILAIVKEEKPFDVFLCYKETDETGKRTQDSVIANDIYYQLTQEGFKVFYAAITLEDKLGQEYEPYIFAALNSAKVMLVIGTRPEYFNAIWVKNEWSRFMNFMKTDRSKLLVPCYKDMDAYDLPEEFSHLQAQDMGKIGFINDVVRGIKKVIVKEEPKEKTKETVVVQQTSGNTSAAAQVKRGNMALEDSDWQKADAFFEEALNLDPESAEAYLGKLLARDRKPGLEAWVNGQKAKYESASTVRLKACEADQAHIENSAGEWELPGYLESKKIKELYDFDLGYNSELSCRKEQKEKQLRELSADKLLSRVKQYASGETKNRMEECLKAITAVLDRRVINAEEADRQSIENVKKSYVKFISQSDKKVAELNKNAQDCREKQYQSAVELMKVAGDIPAYEKARDALHVMNGYKDSRNFAAECQKEIDWIKEEKRKEEEQRAAIQKKEAELAEKKKRKTTAMVIAAAVVCIAVFCVVTKVILPNNNYNAAMALKNEGRYEEALKVFTSLDGYKDSTEKIQEIKPFYHKELLENVSVGSKVFLGAYEQDDEPTNGKEDIEWIVLEKEENKVLLISRYALDAIPYNEKYVDITWEKCTLRSWLNKEFYTTAFNAEEQKCIIESTVTADKNPEYDTNPGNNTKDKVFLLSISEVNKYFSNDEARMCVPTEYAEAQGVYINGGYCWWWLRSPGDFSNFAAIVDYDGSVYEIGIHVYDDNRCVRPALWIDLES